MTELNDNRRWYKRNNCDFPVKVVSPVTLSGRAVNYSDGGILVVVFPTDDSFEITLGQDVELRVQTGDRQRLSTEQKVCGQVCRITFDEGLKSWYVAIEVVGAWEDLPI